MLNLVAPLCVHCRRWSLRSGAGDLRSSGNRRWFVRLFVCFSPRVGENLPSTLLALVIMQNRVGLFFFSTTKINVTFPKVCRCFNSLGLEETAARRCSPPALLFLFGSCSREIVNLDNMSTSGSDVRLRNEVALHCSGAHVPIYCLASCGSPGRRLLAVKRVELPSVIQLR